VGEKGAVNGLRWSEAAYPALVTQTPWTSSNAAWKLRRVPRILDARYAALGREAWGKGSWDIFLTCPLPKILALIKS
jgi:hypothetical protein